MITRQGSDTTCWCSQATLADRECCDVFATSVRCSMRATRTDGTATNPTVPREVIRVLGGVCCPEAAVTACQLQLGETQCAHHPAYPCRRCCSLMQSHHTVCMVQCSLHAPSAQPMAHPMAVPTAYLHVHCTRTLLVMDHLMEAIEAITFSVAGWHCSSNVNSGASVPIACSTHPRVPVRTAGCTRCGQFRTAAVAAAVAGPPTFAFDAVSIASIGNFSRRPPQMMIARCVTSWMAIRQNSQPTSDRASRLPAAAPMVAKKGSNNADPMRLLPASTMHLDATSMDM